MCSRMQFPIRVQMQLSLHPIAAVCRFDFCHSPEHAIAGRAPRPHEQQLCNTGLINFVLHFRMCEQCFDFRAEYQAARNFGVEQRLYTNAIPCQKKAFGAVLPHGKGEDAVELFHTARPPVGIGL